MNIARSLVVLFVVVVGVLASSCVTDSKGASCGFLDALADSAGTTYCPDEKAPDDCKTLFDGFFAKAAGCANDAGLDVTEDQLRAQVPTPDCKTAVATSKTFDDCVKNVDDATCAADGTFPLPDTCKGAVLTSGG